MIPVGVTKKEDSVYYTSDGEFLLYVPEFFFDMKYATIEGEYVTTLGILTYQIVDKNGNADPMRQFYLPYRFTTKPGKMEKKKNFDITDNYRADCRVFHYTNNGSDQIFASTKLVKDVEDVEEIFRLMIKTGKTPNTVRYDEMQNYFVDAMDISGNSFGINIGLFGLVFSETCRDPKNLNKPFRLSNEIDKNMYGYKEVSIVDSPKYISPYASLTSENFDEGLIGAINMDPGDPSPLEKVFIG